MNAEVLDSLHARLEPEQRSAALARILRVPAAWRKLHEPDFLSAFRAAQLPDELTPGHLASLALGGSLAVPLGPQLASERSGQSGEAWQAFTGSSSAPEDLDTLALLALELTLQNDIQSTMQRALENPTGWQDVLAVAWPGHPQREHMLGTLIGAGTTAGLQLAVHVALANLAPQEAARQLQSAGRSPGYALVRYLREHGENDFATTVLQAMSETSDAGSSDLQGRLLQAERLAAEGEPAIAFNALQAAWQDAAATAGQVADALAVHAAEHGDPVLAAEATRRGLENQPSPERRAAYALSLLQLGRTHEAHACLPAESGAPEEQIALGKVLSTHGQPEEARLALHKAADELAAGRLVKDRWYGELSQALTEIESIEAAVQVARLRSERSPTNHAAQIALIRLLEEAGDPAAAAKQARLAFTLNPDAKASRLALAKNLMRAGEASQALPHWEALVSSGTASLLEAGRCALAAGEIERAEAIASRLLEQQVDAPQAATLLGRCLIARGDVSAAQARLREVVGEHPDELEARLALADALSLDDQEQAAGEVLFAAAQAMPHELAAAVALSRWLRRQGRPSEAAEAARNALHASPHAVEAMIEYGEASLQLGSYEAALQTFTRAAQRQPGNWQARHGLARAYEGIGDLISAGEHVGSLPKTADAAKVIEAARITILAAEAKGDAEAVPAAIELLERAAGQSPDEPSIELWMSRAHEVAGRAGEALAGYQRCLARFASEDAESYAAALLGIGRSAMATGEVPLALSTLEQAQKRFPASSEIQCMLSQAYASANLPEKAVKAAERAIEIDGRDAGAWATLGRARAAVGDLEGALLAYQGLSSVQPADPQGWIELAELAHAGETPAVTRKALAEALWRGRRSPEVLSRIADILEKLGAQHSALRMLRAAAAYGPADSQILSRLAESSEQAGDLETAHQAWTRLAGLAPHDSKAFRKSAQALWGLKRVRQAIEQWRRAAELDPRDAHTHRALGKAYMQIGEVQDGLNQFSAALELRPDDAELALEAGVAAMRCGAHLEAVGLFKTAVEHDPASAEAWSSLGESHAVLGQWGEAESALAHAAELQAAPARVAALQVLTSLAMGDLAGAAAWLDQAGRAAFQIAEDAIWMARAALRMGRWTDAVQVLETWLNGSQDPAAQEALAEVRLSILEAHWVCQQADAVAWSPQPALIEAARSLLTSPETYRVRAQVLLEPINTPALEALNRVVEGQDGRVAMHCLAIGWLRAEDPEAALQVLEAVQPPAYDFDWRPLLQGIAYRQIGRPGEALEALEISAQDPVLRPLAEAMQAALRAAVGDPETAIAAWNRALAARPNEWRWHHALAGLYLEQGAMDIGLPHMQQAVELAPGDMSYRMQLAEALSALGHHAEAVASFKLAIDRSEPTADELLLAGEAALEAESPELAMEWYEQALSLAPENPRGLVGAARAAMARGKIRKARERIEAALRTAPHDPQVQLGRGEILAMQRDYQGALQAYEQVRGARGATRARLAQAKSNALLALGQAERAEENLVAELERSDQDPNLWYPLAMVRESRGDLESAAEAAGQAIRLAPLNPDYRLGLARISRHAGNLDRALDELARARELAPADARVPLEQGLVYEDRRDYRRALESYRKAIELDSHCMQAYYRSGLVLKQLKSYPQAGQMLKRAAELAPVDRDVMHQLAAVRALELVHGPSAGVVQ